MGPQRLPLWPIGGPTTQRAQTAATLLWRVIYYSIWIPSCEETTRPDRIFGIPPRTNEDTLQANPNHNVQIIPWIRSY